MSTTFTMAAAASVRLRPLYPIDMNGKDIIDPGDVDGVDISAHAANASAHHAKYTDEEAVAAVEGEADLSLSGNVGMAADKTVDGVDISKLPVHIHQSAIGSGSTGETSYVDLVSLGSKTFYGNKVLIMWSGIFRNSSTPNGVQVGLFIDDVEDENLRGKDHSVANNYYFTLSRQKIRDLSATSHTIKLKYYAADAGTAQANHVIITVIEFGS